MIGLIDKDRAQMSAGPGLALARQVGDAAKAVAQAFRVLQHIQYGRPWGATKGRCEG